MLYYKYYFPRMPPQQCSSAPIIKRAIICNNCCDTRGMGGFQYAKYTHANVADRPYRQRAFRSSVGDRVAAQWRRCSHAVCQRVERAIICNCCGRAMGGSSDLYDKCVQANAATHPRRQRAF